MKISTFKLILLIGLSSFFYSSKGQTIQSEETIIFEDDASLIPKKNISTIEADSSFSILTRNIISKFNSLTLSDIQKIESNFNSTVFKSQFIVKLGASIYPNKKCYKLQEPKTYSRTEDSNFTCQVEYFYTPKDSSVKVVMFEWNQNNLSQKTKADPFLIKFNKIDQFISYTCKTTPNKKTETFRDNFKNIITWQTNNGLFIEMLLFSNSSGYRQIRLKIFEN